MIQPQSLARTAAASSISAAALLAVSGEASPVFVKTSAEPSPSGTFGATEPSIALFAATASVAFDNTVISDM
jgi:hypothetical protein